LPPVTTVQVLVLNCGSSSVKFQVVALDAAGAAPAPDCRRPRGTIAHIGTEARCTFVDHTGNAQSETLSIRSHGEALAHMFMHLGWHGGRTGHPVDAVGHRIVHGGDRFTAATRIDPQTLAGIESLNELAPLHNPACVSGINAARAALGSEVPMVAVFDTAFHHTLPDHAATYAIPADLAARHRIRRYGFHGIAHNYVAARYADIRGVALDRLNLITLHLGNGCSAAAIRHGRSVDTSMGFTPLEGLVMGTRCGDLDPAVVSYVARRESVSADTVEAWLNERSGLLGISGRSNDVRELVDAMDSDARARLAIEVFCYRAAKYVGAYLTVLGGADAVIFSGGIGENSPAVRAGICERLRWCGVVLDPQRNAQTIGHEGCITANRSATRRTAADGSLRAYVIPADEELLIARETSRCLR